MRPYLLPSILISLFALSACSVADPGPTQGGSQPVVPTQGRPDPVSMEPTALEEDSANLSGLARVDRQGQVVVEVTPVDLDAPAGSIEFEIVMNTHSVDLSMDLALLSTLTTDTGVTIQASLWDAPRGGHHVSGRLIFPATLDGISILDGATRLTLTILDVDVTTRIFEWQLP